MTLFIARLSAEKGEESTLGWNVLHVLQVVPTHVEKLDPNEVEDDPDLDPGPTHYLQPAYFCLCDGPNGTLNATHVDCESLDLEIQRGIYTVELP